MFGKPRMLFRLSGIPISLDASWLIILALLTMSLASLFPALMRDYFGEAAADLNPYVYWIMSVVTQVPRAEWEQHTVGEVMEHDFTPITIRPDADALDALGQMHRTGSSRLLVTEDDRLVGIISLKDLLRFLHLKIELEGMEEDRSSPSVPQPQSKPERALAHR